MITLEQYQEAQKIVDTYKLQLEEEMQKQEEERIKKQSEREKQCDEHYYLPRGKWQSGMQCQFCMKIID